MKIIKELKVADLFTIANAVSGLLSILYAIKGELVIAALLMVLAVLFDFLDGRIAHHTGTANDFGKQLDSLSDLISFGIAPAVFGFASGLDGPVHLVVLAFFVVCGMLRLARFNILKIRGFLGMPITVNGILFPVLYFLIPFDTYMLLVYMLMALLMISDIKIKKI